MSPPRKPAFLHKLPWLLLPSGRGVSVGETPETTHIYIYCLLLNMSFAIIFILSFKMLSNMSLSLIFPGAQKTHVSCIRRSLLCLQQFFYNYVIDD